MLTLNDVVDDATARQWFREQWRRPEFVAEMLDRYQYEALAGVVRYPALGRECTAHLFFSPDGAYIGIIRALKASNFSPQGAVDKLCGRGREICHAELLASILGHPVTIWSARRAIGKVEKIVAWKYQQEKKAKCKI